MRYEIDVVVSRYEENYDWIYKLPSNANVIMYNKGTDLVGAAHPLPNFGREAHTFLHHILAVYNKLPNYESDWICFLQGNPFDHCPDIIEQLNSEIYKAEPFTPLGNFRPTCDLNGAPHHAGLQIANFCNAIQLNVPEKLTFTAGGQFVIHKRLIQRLPATFYWQLLVNTVIDDQVPYIMERLWEQIFKNG